MTLSDSEIIAKGFKSLQIISVLDQILRFFSNRCLKRHQNIWDVFEAIWKYLKHLKFLKFFLKIKIEEEKSLLF